MRADKKGACRHCGMPIVHYVGETLGVGDLPDLTACWRNLNVQTGQAWCSQTAFDGPPHEPAVLPDLTDPRAVERWLATDETPPP